MSYNSSCSGDSFIDAIEEENGVSRMVIMGLTGLRDSLRVLAKMKVLPSEGMSLRVHPFLYEMSGAPCKFIFFLRWIFFL